MRRFLVIVSILISFITIQSLGIETNAFFAKKTSKQEQAREKYQQEMRKSEPKEDYNYAKAYENLKDTKVEFIHDEDPDEYYETQKVYFSPYPLMRLTQPLYMKKQTIQPGFYLLTPRDYAGQRCVLFKQGGKIKHIIPVWQYKTVIPEFEYNKPPKRWWQIRDRYVFQTQYYERKIHTKDVYGGEFYEIDLYYMDGLSKMLFKKHPY